MIILSEDEEEDVVSCISSSCFLFAETGAGVLAAAVRRFRKGSDDSPLPLLESQPLPLITGASASSLISVAVIDSATASFATFE